MKRTLSIAGISLALSFGAGFIGSFFTMPQIESWYRLLDKPFFSPPDFVFGPVWSLLYLMIAISLFLFWKKGIETHYQKKILQIFLLQILLNTLWSLVFFGMESILGGLVVILLLLYSIFLLIKHFWYDYRASAYLLVPYFLWVTFATMLNVALLILN